LRPTRASSQQENCRNGLRRTHATATIAVHDILTIEGN
jgi:hypothetical protein